MIEANANRVTRSGCHASRRGRYGPLVSAALVVMAKEPRPGAAKTRLCPPLDHAQAAALAEAALADTLDVVSRTAASRLVLALDGAPGAWLPAGFEVVAQRGDGLGQRLSNVTRDVGETLIVVGMDTPQLTVALLSDALRRLGEDGAGAVLGPTTDGGYWTIGLREPDPSAFDGVPMSTTATAGAQRARLAQLGLHTIELEALRDVDTYEDARAVAALAPWTRFAATFDLLTR
jgi:rSAM/selenodomain-associated transferase 1